MFHDDSILFKLGLKMFLLGSACVVSYKGNLHGVTTETCNIMYDPFDSKSDTAILINADGICRRESLDIR